jgi:hypothetical protein
MERCWAAINIPTVSNSAACSARRYRRRVSVGTGLDAGTANAIPGRGVADGPWFRLIKVGECWNAARNWERGQGSTGHETRAARDLDRCRPQRLAADVNRNGRSEKRRTCEQPAPSLGKEDRRPSDCGGLGDRRSKPCRGPSGLRETAKCRTRSSKAVRRSQANRKRS